jgi:hypothetical protein
MRKKERHSFCLNIMCTVKKTGEILFPYMLGKFGKEWAQSPEEQENSFPKK